MRRWPLFLIAFLGLLPPLHAELTLDDLKDRQDAMRRTVRAAHPATVGILFPESSGAGSGVIVREDGLVLTAAHVSGDADRDVTIILPSGERLPGKTLGAYRSLDAGMIQITAERRSFPVVPVGKSEDLELGQWCLAVGHPGGFSEERSAPVRLGRVLDKDANGFLVTDSTLVGGDSGGPLFDLQGRLVGIHSSIGFELEENRHVPIDVFHEHWDAMRSGEVVGNLFDWVRQDTPFLGIITNPGDEVPDDRVGAHIAQVIDGSPAQEAGLEVGDCIVEANGRTIENGRQLIRSIRRKGIGDTLDLKVLSADGATRAIAVTLGAFRDFQEQLRRTPPDDPEPNPDPEPRRGFLGVALTQGDDDAVTIAQVLADSAASEAGLKRGDVLLQADGQKVEDVSTFIESISERAPGAVVDLVVVRDSGLVRVKVTLAERPPNTEQPE